MHHTESLSKNRKQTNKILPDLFCKITTPCLLVLVILYMMYSGTICVGCKTSSKDGTPKMVCKLWGGKEQMLSKRFASNEWKQVLSVLFKHRLLDKLVCCLINSHFQKNNLRTHFFLGQTPKPIKNEHLWYLKYTSTPATIDFNKFLKYNNPMLINTWESICKQ